MHSIWEGRAAGDFMSTMMVNDSVFACIYLCEGPRGRITPLSRVLSPDLLLLRTDQVTSKPRCRCHSYLGRVVQLFISATYLRLFHVLSVHFSTQMPPNSLIDLSHPLTPHTPVYPGDPSFTMHRICSIPTHGYTVHTLSLGTHTGTHVDAPFHFFEQGEKLHELPLERFVGRALVVDVRHLARERGRIEWDDVQECLGRDTTCSSAGGALASLGARSEGKIDIVLFWTGWDEWWGEQKYFEHPCFGREVAEELAGMSVRVVGVDALSPDKTGLVQDREEERRDPFAMHEVLLGRGCLIYENLTNLGALVCKGCAGEEVWVSLVPMNVHGADGGPVRAYGWKETLCT